MIPVRENPSFSGTFRVACGRLYFSSTSSVSYQCWFSFILLKTLRVVNLQKTWSDAAADCCKRSMTLFAIESTEEQSCVWNTIINRNK